MCSQCLVICVLSTVCLMLMSDGALAKPGHYTHHWAVHIEGGRNVADQVAAEHGFVNLDEIIPDHYHFRHNSVHRRSANPSPHHHTRLSNDGRVRWAQQQRILSRKKRDFIPLTMLLKSTSSPADVRLTSFTSTPNSSTTIGIRPDRDLVPPFFQGDKRMRNNALSYSTGTFFPVNDPLWPKMWYLNRGGGLDMNVVEAWNEGVTGKGIVVTILDDGLEKDHPDLLLNYDPQASYDVNNHDEDPMPRYDMIDSNRHGTRCAGEVAATVNNSLCAVGIAFGANVGGVRMLDGDVTDAVEARSLSLNPQHIDIYSASWGPDDDGKTVDGPGELATRAFIEGVNKGRSGKGSIFVWASGNGGNERDNCNCDGYTNSIWTLSISSATENGDVPWYSEMCSSTLATTYSSGSSTERQVITTDLHHSCTSSHTGTSASAPLAAGICALALEANRDLTWRDMQHIVVRTAKPANLQQSGWKTNGVGRNVSHSFGYGLMDAAAMVRMARTWKTVPMQNRCEVSSPHINKSIPPKSLVVLQLIVDHCGGVNYLEHVQAKITLSAPRRGDLQINLTSPSGTMVTLLATRSHDVSRAGFVAWPFMSVHTWGESPYGIWQLNIHNEGKYMASLSKWDLIFYGTDTPAQPESDLIPDTKVEPLNTGGHLGIGEGEAGQHNSLEEGFVSNKWRDGQRVREEGRIEVRPGEPNTGNAEFSSSGCLNYAPSQLHQCIECHQSYFLYAGKCVSGCPAKTFPSVSFPRRKPQLKPLTLQSDEFSPEPVSSSLRRSLEKFEYNQRNVMKPQPPKSCLDCHYMCLNCTGPYNYQCTSCPNNSKLINTTNPNGVVESYCYPSSLLSASDNEVWLKRFYIFFGIAAFVIVCAILYLTISKLLSVVDMCNKSKHQEKAQSNIGYNRLNPDEKTTIDLGIDSDSDSSV